jgi:hypothetical protein
MMTPVVHSAASQILYAIPPGKPDPKAFCSKETVYSRPRVVQQAQKGPTCWYYALNMVRARIGKNPSEDFIQEREIEKIVSLRRKLVTRIRSEQDSDLAIVKQLMEDPNYTKHQLWMKEGALKLRPLFKRLSEDPKTVEREEVVKVDTILKGFVEQDRFKDLKAYVCALYCEQLNKINYMYLKNLGQNPEKYFYEDQAADSLSVVREWSSVSDQEKRALLDNYFFRASFEKYGLQVSPWHPEHGPQRLVEVLRDKGPMYTKGQLGRAYYAEDPHVVDKIDSRNILGWKKGAKRVDLQIFHSVVVVGASFEGRGFVYFVDPLDQSGPEEERPIYVSSYDKFICHIGDLRNRYIVKSDDAKPVFFPNARYGLHAPQ